MADADLDLFGGSEPSNNTGYQLGRQPHTFTQDDQHVDGEFSDYTDPTLHHALSTPENPSYMIPVVSKGQDNMVEDEQVGDPNMLENMRREEETIHQKLIAKAQAEADLKQQRKAKGQKQLQEYQNERERQIEELRAKNKAQQSAQLNTKEYKTPWEKVADNIALKEGEYPGTKDVSRMRQAIVNKKNDG